MGIVLGARLAAILDMLGTRKTVADIGADHGRLAVALLQQQRAQRVIASDISDLSLHKARSLARTCNMEALMDFRVADGLTGLQQNEADALVLAGMGGALIARIFETSPEIAQTAGRIVMQPMRGTAELRYYLHHNGFCIEDERIVCESGRYYQILAARYGEPEEIPEGFPEGVYKFGWVMVQKRDPLLLPLLLRYIAGHKKRLQKAQSAGAAPKALIEELEQLEALARMLEVEP